MDCGRRAFAFGGLASLAACEWALPALGQTYRRIPERLGARVIVDNDFAGDPDGILALTHQALASRTTVPLVTVSGLAPRPDGLGASHQSVAAGVTLVSEMFARLQARVPPAVAGGHELGAASLAPSSAALAIVAEAMREDPLPLFFSCGGPLTNLAEALRLEPAISERMTVIWIGGGSYPDGGWEYNLAADLAAARHVLENSTVPIWQVPQSAYRTMSVSLAEMEADLRPISDFTQWLYQRFTNPPDFVDMGGAWPMGDSPPVLLTAISRESSQSRDWTARRLRDDLTYGEEIPGRLVRVYHSLDMRLTWADFLARLRLHALAKGSN